MTARPIPDRKQVTTAAELDSLPEADVLLLASGTYPGDKGAFHDCWVRPIPSWITGTDERAWEVLVYGETWPGNVVSTADLNLPATVLFRPDAPTPDAACRWCGGVNGEHDGAMHDAVAATGTPAYWHPDAPTPTPAGGWRCPGWREPVDGRDDRCDVCGIRKPFHATPTPADEDRREALARDDEMARAYRDAYPFVRALGEHRYETASRGSRPNDPGWHPCMCGWEGYWSEWHPHLALALLASRPTPANEDRETLIRTLVEHADCAPSEGGMDCGLSLPEPSDQDDEAGAFTRAHQADAWLASRPSAPSVTAEQVRKVSIALADSIGFQGYHGVADTDALARIALTALGIEVRDA